MTEAMKVAPRFAHEWVLETAIRPETLGPLRDRKGHRREPRTICVHCRSDKALALPWCMKLLTPAGVHLAVGPDRQVLPTHNLGDDIARQILSGEIALEDAQRWEQVRRQRCGELAGSQKER